MAGGQLAFNEQALLVFLNDRPLANNWTVMIPAHLDRALTLLDGLLVSTGQDGVTVAVGAAKHGGIAAELAPAALFVELQLDSSQIKILAFH